MIDKRRRTNKAMGPNMNKLVDQYIAGEDGPVTHIDMTGNTGVINQNTVVANNAIMADMNIGHQ